MEPGAATEVEATVVGKEGAWAAVATAQVMGEEVGETVAEED